MKFEIIFITTFFCILKEVRCYNDEKVLGKWMGFFGKFILNESNTQVTLEIYPYFRGTIQHYL